MSVIAQAVILVGGKGTRLGALTAATPKPLMPMSDGRPFLDHLIENVARQGVGRILLLAGHFGEQITARYHGRLIGRAHVDVIVEPEPAGTAGALLLAAPALDDAFYLMNGDSIIDINLRSLDAAAGDSLFAMAVREVDNAGRYGSVAMDAEGRVIRFEEKRPDSDQPGRINAGVYLLRRDVLDLIDRTPMSIESDVFPRLAERKAIVAVPASGYFIDIGLPDTLERAALEVPRLSHRPLAAIATAAPSNGDLRAWIGADDAYETIRALNDGGWRTAVLVGGAPPADAEAVLTRIATDLAAHGGFADVLAFSTSPAEDLAVLIADAQNDPSRQIIVDAGARLPPALATHTLNGGSLSDLIAATINV